MTTTFIEKTVGRNELGQTGSHQSGVLIPKAPEIVGFFPLLPTDEFNPRLSLHFWNSESARYWSMNFIYYNGKLHGLSSRNEYRLTGTTAFFRHLAVDAGDILRFERGSHGLEIAVRRKDLPADPVVTGRIRLMYSGEWNYEMGASE